MMAARAWQVAAVHWFAAAVLYLADGVWQILSGSGLLVSDRCWPITAWRLDQAGPGKRWKQIGCVTAMRGGFCGADSV